MLGNGHENAHHVGGHNGSNLSGHYAYNGSSWSTLNSLNNARFVPQCCGTTLDAFVTGGSRHANNDSEFWDGTSWAAGPTNTADKYSPSSTIDCAGTSAAVCFAGGSGSSYSAATNAVMHFDR